LRDITAQLLKHDENRDRLKFREELIRRYVYDIPESIDFIKNEITDDELLLLSGYLEDFIIKTQSRELFEAFKNRSKSVKDKVTKKFVD